MATATPGYDPHMRSVAQAATTPWMTFFQSGCPKQTAHTSYVARRVRRPTPFLGPLQRLAGWTAGIRVGCTSVPGRWGPAERGRRWGWGWSRGLAELEGSAERSGRRRRSGPVGDC